SESGHIDQVSGSGGDPAWPALAGLALSRGRPAGADERDRVSARRPRGAEEGQPDRQRGALDLRGADAHALVLGWHLADYLLQHATGAVSGVGVWQRIAR